jgi:hypothetical protein
VSPIVRTVITCATITATGDPPVFSLHDVFYSLVPVSLEEPVSLSLSSSRILN